MIVYIGVAGRARELAASDAGCACAGGGGLMVTRERTHRRSLRRRRTKPVGDCGDRGTGTTRTRRCAAGSRSPTLTLEGGEAEAVTSVLSQACEVGGQWQLSSFLSAARIITKCHPDVSGVGSI